MNNWTILGIAATDDREVIKKAYMSQLSKYNPEDDAEGFTRLRTAYEQVLKELDNKSQEEEDTTPPGLFIKRVEDVYNDFTLRCDVEKWKELLTDEACVRLDMVDAAEEKLLAFLMNSFYLPKAIWVTLDSHFDWQAKAAALKQDFPPNFIDFVISNATRDEFLKYDLFTVDSKYGGIVETHQYDRWIWLYYEIDAKISMGDIDNEAFLEMKNEIEALPIKHVYYDLQLARIHMEKEEPEQALAITNPLINQMPNDPAIGYAYGLALLSAKQDEKALVHFEIMLRRNPADISAKKGLVDAMIALGDYEPARSILMDILDEYPYDSFAIHYFQHVTGMLIGTYEEKHKENPDDIEITLTLAKHYNNNQKYEQSRTLLESISPPLEDVRYYEYLADCYIVARDYENSIPLYEKLIALATETKYRYYVKFVTSLNAMGEYEQALTRIEEFLSLELEDDDKHFKAQLHDCKALALFQLGRPEDALETLDQSIAINNRSAGAYLHKARVYQSMGRYSEAIDCCEQSINIYPYNSEAYTLQMEIFNSYGMYEQMLAVSDWADQMRLDSPRVKYHKAGALRMMGESEQAREIITALLEAEFDEGYRDYFHVEAAHLATAEKDWDTALFHIRKAIDLYPDFTYRHFLLGKIHHLRGAYDEAFEVYDKILEEYPDFIYALIGRGDLYMEQEEYEQARADFEAALAVNPDNDEIFGSIIETYIAEEQYEEALQWAKRRLEMLETIGNYLDIAWLYSRMNQLDKADAYYQEIIERFPEDEAAHRFYGIYLRNINMHEEAVTQFKLSLEKDEGQTYLYEEIAFCLECLKQYEQALVVLDKGEALQSESTGAIIMRRGVILEKMGRYQEAVENMLRAADLHDQLAGYWEIADIYSRIGFTYEIYLNDAQNALKYYQAALEQKDTCAEALRGIGDLYLYFFKDYHKAIEYYSRKIELEPDEPHAYVVRAKALSLLEDGLMSKMRNYYSAARDYKTALDLYEKDAEDMPDSLCSQVYIATCYVGLKKYDKARKLFQLMLDEPWKKVSWCDKEQCDSCFYNLGQIYEIEKNYSEALAHYEKARAITNSVRHNKVIEELMAKMK